MVRYIRKGVEKILNLVFLVGDEITDVILSIAIISNLLSLFVI